MTSATHSTLGDPLILSRLQSFRPILGLIALVAITFAGYATIRSLLRTEQGVIHVDEVQKELQNLQLQLSLLHDYSSEYFLGRNENAAANFEVARQTALAALARMKELSTDNLVQEQLRKIEPLLLRHITELEPTTRSEHTVSGITPNKAQIQIEDRGLDLQISQITAEMGGEEERLMSARQFSLNRALLRNVILLATAVGVSMLLLLSNVYVLRQEVRAREQAAERSRESAESYRALTARILAGHDAERRNIGRELHDRVGQELTGALMGLEQLARCDPKDEAVIQEALGCVRNSIREVRTLSQLLHPPLLELAGFVAAARSYAEQFGRRSAIKININLPDDVKLPSKEAELMLFRVLQESLTNVHRHAQATSVDISLAQEKNRIVLMIHDNGRGISPEVMERFNLGVAFGVGMAGQRERLAEFGGTLELESSSSGTTVRATLPL